jgi:hypothetical protein
MARRFLFPSALKNSNLKVIHTPIESLLFNTTAMTQLLAITKIAPNILIVVGVR